MAAITPQSSQLLLSLELFLGGTTFGALVRWLGACVNIATNSADPRGGAVGGSFVGFGSLSFLHVLFLLSVGFQPVPESASSGTVHTIRIVHFKSQCKFLLRISATFQHQVFHLFQYPEGGNSFR